jgi:hypothetical protein
MVGAPHPAVQFRPPRQPALATHFPGRSHSKQRECDALMHFVYYVFLSRDVNSAVAIRMQGEKHRVCLVVSR